MLETAILSKKHIFKAIIMWEKSWWMTQEKLFGFLVMEELEFMEKK